VQYEAVFIFLFLVVYMICAGIKALFRWATGEAQREEIEPDNKHTLPQELRLRKLQK
jgi:hypothetical protein